MKNKIVIKYEHIALFFFSMFLLFLFIIIALPSFQSNNNDFIFEISIILAFFNGTIGIFAYFIYINKNDKNAAIKIDKRKVFKILSIKNFIIVSLILCLIILSFIGINEYIIKYEYKDLYYSLNDNSDIDDRINKSNLTKDYKSLDSNMFLGYKIDNKEIIESYLCYILDNRLTCLKGFDKSSYQANLKKINKSFGKGNCYKYNSNYHCEKDSIEVSINSANNFNIMTDYMEYEDGDYDSNYCYIEDNHFSCTFKKDFN